MVVHGNVATLVISLLYLTTFLVPIGKMSVPGALDQLTHAIPSKLSRDVFDTSEDLILSGQFLFSGLSNASAQGFATAYHFQLMVGNIPYLNY